MVCKINYDYEILLSGDSDSSTESDTSDNESNKCKKFVLGDNIQTINPIEIISVRQLNDNILMEKVPMNYYIHYDEAFSNFEEEIVTESETDMHPEFTLSPEKAFEYPHEPLQYELPTVKRFEIDSQPSIQFGKNISQINKYCFNEKSRRIKMEIEEKEESNKVCNQTVKRNKSKLKNNEQSTVTKRPDFNEISQNFEKENLISSEKLSNLPIDLLTEFINGEKSLYELSQINNNKKEDQKKLKKTKRTKTKKKITKSNERFPENMKVNNVSVIKMDLVQSTSNLPKTHAEIPFFQNLSPENLIISDTQTLQHKPNNNEPINTLENYKSKSTETIKVIEPTTKFMKKVKTIKSTFQENKINCSNKMLKSQLEENFDKSSNLEPNVIKCFNYDQENTHIQPSEYSYTDKNDYLTKIHESKLNSACQSGLHFEAKTYDGGFNLPDNHISPVLREDKFFENQLGIYPTIDDCKDNRTSSTDSGFQDIDSNDINDETQSTIYFPIKDSLSINLSKESELDLTIKPQEISTEISSSIKKVLDLSSFKFNFINESILTEKNIGQKILNTSQVYQSSEIYKNQNPETSYNKDEIHSKPNFRETVIQPDRFYDYIYNNEPNHRDYYSNIQLCANNFPSLIGCDLDLNEENVSNKTITAESNFVVKENDIITANYDSDYNPFKINYYSSQSTINSKNEISQFLNFQWFKFCEKYTMFNHDLMIL